MVNCRYCNRFRLTRLAGPGVWLLECGHAYLPLPTEAQRWAAYTGIAARAVSDVVGWADSTL
jgi:hypothetical protein